MEGKGRGREGREGENDLTHLLSQIPGYATGMGRGYPLPSRLGGLGSVVSSPSGVRGGAPAENGFWCILSFKKRIW